MPGYSVRWTGDRTRPTPSSPEARDGELLLDRGVIRVQRFVRDATLGEERVILRERHLAVGHAVTMTPAPSASYPGTGPFTLTDGLHGGLQHDDGLWAGWWGPDVEIVVDLGEQLPERLVLIGFLHNPRSWILLPRQVELSWSNDGVQWTVPAVSTVAAPDAPDAITIRTIAQRIPPARYLRVVARNAGPLPAGHPGAGQPSWLFMDEVVVRRWTGELRP